ncbi:hypothetical protein M2284_002346 [Rhodococcus sp. LBL1]|uniref:Uncharacterized protein n=1 Tax=Prescottella agglutinans TaxID=1644129 RepID=A0ABT6M7C0_9NOCA|nr:hypothetical protein [Prescottella agglutinans]MDH6678143.1 hypothetical protein [Rhodococcus sp. LBL1]MDH6683730.1 hypothetical protein [Rhodococcus sp. LBL2]
MGDAKARTENRFGGFVPAKTWRVSARLLAERSGTA